MHRPKAAWQVLTEKSFGGALLLAFLILSCGKANNSSSNPPPPPPANTEALSVDAGPTNSFVNGLFTTITVCAPGTSTCNTIDHVLVDTGSYGLRLLASGAAGGKLTLALSQQTNSTGAVAECAQFADSFTWGPVAIADVKISGEKASSVPIQVVGDANYPDSTAPTIASCTNGSTIPSGDTLGALGANGILGVGVFTDDCGPACASTTSNPGVYFACPSPPTSSSSCAVIAEPESSQLQSPVWMFSSDNNGLSISMPSVPPTEVGALTESGTLTFGIGTQSNNALGNAKVYTTDGFGNFTTNYSGSSYGTNGVPNSQSFIDSGSGAMFFLDPITTGIPNLLSARIRHCGRPAT